MAHMVCQTLFALQPFSIWEAASSTNYRCRYHATTAGDRVGEGGGGGRQQAEQQREHVAACRI